MEGMQNQQVDPTASVAGNGGGDSATQEHHESMKKRSRWVRLAFLVVFVLVSAMPVVNGCNGRLHISSVELMTLNLPSSSVENEQFLPYTVSSILVLWAAVIVICIGVFRITDTVRSLPLTIGGGILLLYLLIVVSFVFKDERTARLVSLDVGWFLMFGVVAMLFFHKRILQGILARMGPIGVIPSPLHADTGPKPPITATVAAENDVAMPPAEPAESIEASSSAESDMVVEAAGAPSAAAMAAAAPAQVIGKKTRKKLKTWQKALVAVGGVIMLAIIIVAVFAYMEYSRQQQAIQITKDAEYGGMTWGEYAKSDIEENPNTNYQWLATNRGEDNIYFVQFLDGEGWGRHWETNIEEGTVKWINNDEFLSRKYGLNSVYPGEYELSRDGDGTFSVQVDSDADGGATIRYALRGEVVNNSGKHVSEAEIGYNVMLIYPDKTIHVKNSGSFIIDQEVSARYPWKPGAAIPISFTSNALDAAYLRTEPAYFVCQISVLAEDLTGYEFKRCIAEIDLSDRWENLKKLVGEQKEIVKRAEGAFYRKGENAEARLTIRNLYGNLYSVSGMALYGTQSEFGPNYGTLEFTAELSGSRITHTEDTYEGGTYTIEINIGPSGISVRESGSDNDFGMNVSFAGEYVKE